jgi:DNA-binding transcriptional MerR regulator
MRVSDLSRKSGVSVATIKFYLRERLLPTGKPTARNQAEYDDTHLSRLRLVRTLITLGQLRLSSVREVMTAVDTKGLSVQGLCQVVNRALFADQPTATGDDAIEPARMRVDDFIDSLDWLVAPDSPGRSTLANVLAALRRLGSNCDADIFAPYAAAAEELAVHEIVSTPDGPPETVVATTILLEVALVCMRRMAHEHHLALRSAGVIAGNSTRQGDT